MRFRTVSIFFALLCLSSLTIGTDIAQDNIQGVLDAHSPECTDRPKLFVAVNPEVIPFTFLVKDKDGGSRFAGMDVELITQLAKQLNYCLTFNEMPVTSTAQFLIDDVNNVNTNTNMAIGAITVTGKRLQIVDFTQPYYDTGLRILVNKVLDNVNTSTFWQILKPFDVWLWVAIGVAFFVFAATAYLFERRKNEVDFMYSSKLSNAGLSLFYTAALFMNQPYATPESAAGRVANLAFLLFALVMVSSYTAQLASFLIVRPSFLYFRDVDGNGIINQVDLKQQVTEICIKGGGAVEEYFIKKIGTGYMRADTIEECVTAVTSNRVRGFAYDAPILEYFATQFPGQFAVIGEIFYSQNYGIAFQKQLRPIAKNLSESLLLFRENGYVDSLEYKYIPWPEISQGGDLFQLRVNEAVGLFIIVGIFMFLSWAVFLFSEYRHGFRSFNKNELRRVQTVNDQSKQRVLENLRQNGTLPSRAMSERLVLQSVLEAADALLDDDKEEVADKGADGKASADGEKKGFGRLKDRLTRRKVIPTSQSAIDVGPQSTQFGSPADV